MGNPLVARMQGFGTTIFAEMSALALSTGAINLGQGFPELGYVSLAELQSVRGRLGLSIERDLHFIATKPISAYAREARHAERIVA